MIISIIAAMDRNRLIGNNNELPWHLPADFAHFKAVTMGKPILMGRKTYESIGKPLPGRTNIVMSRQGFQAEGIVSVSSICEATALTINDDEVMLIGGSSIYESMVDVVDRMYLTYVDGEFSGDAWFPDFSAEDWEVSEDITVKADEKNKYDCRFVTYDKKIEG